MTSLADYRGYVFPLNVYAHTLMLEEGEVKYLHQGLFSDPGTPVSAAQRHALQLMLEHLPFPPCRILDVGVGLDSALVELKQLGHEVTSIAPCPAQAGSAQRCMGNDLPVTCARYEDFSAPAEFFDVIVFRGSAQSISPMDIFSRAAEHLAASGEILILDEFALKRTAPGKEKLHLLKDFIALGKRFGFEVAAQLDLSPMAAPALDYWLDGIKKHRDRLAEDLGLPAQSLDELTLSIQSDREKHAAGIFGHRLLRLKRTTMPRWLPGEITQANHEQMLALFKNCFGHEMSPAHWNWKYAEGRGQAVGVWQGKELIAHYGGTTRDILMFGQPRKGLFPCDVMVKQEGRGSLSRKGPLFLASASFLESHQGYGKMHTVALGFPNKRACAVASHLGLHYHDEVDHMLEIGWAPRPCRPQVWTELKKLSRDTRYSKEVTDRLWREMSRDFSAGLIGVRDWNYLKYRYIDHPDKHYEICLVRNRMGRRPRGVIVYHLQERDCELLDIIAPLKEIPALIEQARKIAGCQGADRLYCWIAAGYSHLFESTEGQARDLGISIPACLWTEGPPLEQIRQRCWLMGGDTDFR